MARRLFNVNNEFKIMKEKIEEFKEKWFRDYSYISMELTDEEIEELIEMTKDSRYPMERALDLGSDKLMSQGRADYVE